MYAHHYTVPDGLDIKLIGAVRWKSSALGHQVLSLWRTPDDRAYYCQELYQPWSMPFWMTTRMSDLVECTVQEFETHVDLIERMCPREEREGLNHRFSELFALWGYASGTDKAIEKKIREVRGDG